MSDETPPTAPGHVAAILLAAGASARMDGVDKPWADLAGRPVVARSLQVLLSLSEVEMLVCVAPRERHHELRALAGETAARVVCVEGGARRQDSVAAGMAAAIDAAWYLVHDAARPLASPALARRVLAAAREHGAAVPGAPVVDTLKRVDGSGRVIETVDRGALRAVQTPQAFAAELLRRAHAEVAADVTDDAAMVEALGGRVVVVGGEPENLKITTPGDLEIARLLLSRRERSV